MDSVSNQDSNLIHSSKIYQILYLSDISDKNLFATFIISNVFILIRYYYTFVSSGYTEIKISRVVMPMAICLYICSYLAMVMPFSLYWNTGLIRNCVSILNDNIAEANCSNLPIIVYYLSL